MLLLILSLVKLPLELQAALEVGPGVGVGSVDDDLAGLTVAPGLVTDPARRRLVAHLGTPAAWTGVGKGVEGADELTLVLLRPQFATNNVDGEHLRRDDFDGGAIEVLGGWGLLGGLVLLELLELLLLELLELLLGVGELPLGVGELRLKVLAILSDCIRGRDDTMVGMGTKKFHCVFLVGVLGHVNFVTGGELC